MKRRTKPHPVPSTWSSVRLELAPSPNHPHGSVRHSYVIVLPLDMLGQIDQIARRAAPKLCTICRVWEGEGDATGHVVHRGLRQWAFSYGTGREDDELVPHLTEHVFRVGEYLAVREASSTLWIMRVITVIPVNSGLDTNTPSQRTIGGIADYPRPSPTIKEHSAWSKNEAPRGEPTGPLGVGVTRLRDI
jgi:hypothetical protein